MKLLVPDRLAGAIIGKGGSGIVELETQSGCALRLSASGVYFPGTSERVMVVGAPEPAAYEKLIPILYVGGYFPFSYLENGSIKIARSLGVRAAGGKPKWSL